MVEHLSPLCKKKKEEEEETFHLCKKKNLNVKIVLQFIIQVCIKIKISIASNHTERNSQEQQFNTNCKT